MPRRVVRFVSLLILFLPLSLAAESAWAAGARQQIFKYSNQEKPSRLLEAKGVAGYVISARGSERGLVITDTQAGGLADRIGLVPGDVLLRLNDSAIATTYQADQALSQASSGMLVAVFVKPGERELKLYQQAVPYTNTARRMASTAYSYAGRGSGRQSISQLETYVLDLVNADRQKNGVSKVSSNGALSALARAYAEDMSKRRFKGHIDPEGRNPRARASAAGIRVGVSENIAWCFGKPTLEEMAKTCQDSMMSEPADNPLNHRGNILNPDHVVVGIGVALSPGNEIIIVQEFADSVP
jgi:uncharacterized protein YkwD